MDRKRLEIVDTIGRRIDFSGVATRISYKHQTVLIRDVEIDGLYVDHLWIHPRYFQGFIKGLKLESKQNFSGVGFSYDRSSGVLGISFREVEFFVDRVTPRYSTYLYSLVRTSAYKSLIYRCFLNALEDIIEMNKYLVGELNGLLEEKGNKARKLPRFKKLKKINAHIVKKLALWIDNSEEGLDEYNSCYNVITSNQLLYLTANMEVSRRLQRRFTEYFIHPFEDFLMMETVSEEIVEGWIEEEKVEISAKELSRKFQLT